MTTIDYKEKYEAALERCKKLYNEAKANEYTSDIEDYETIFPELKKSDDERIRKALLNEFIHLQSNGYKFAGLEGEEIIAWLEKQNNEKLEEQLDKMIEADLSWLEKQGKSSEQIHYWTEEEIEPIISDYLRGAEHYGGMIGRLRCLKPKSLEKQGEQKPAEWSEEDEDNYKRILEILQDCHAYGRYDLRMDEHAALKNWLKSLKGRVQPQTKQEWSEEDERERKRVVCLLEGWLSTFKETSYAEDCNRGINWLKSIRPYKQ